MSDRIISRSPSFAQVAITVVTLGLSVACARWSGLREFATILLFLPLIWAYMRLSVGGMVTVTLLFAAVRVGVEALQFRSRTGGVPWVQVLGEAAFPIALYVALAVAFFVYRRTLAKMIAQVARSRSMEAIQHLTGSLAHDFGNLMQVITGMAQILVRNPKLDEETREGLGDILSAGRQASGLLEEMHDFAQRSTQMARCDLNDLACRQTRLIRRAIAKGIEVSCKCADEPLPVQADEAQIGRLLTNLCTNARSAMPAGGMLTIRTMRSAHDGRPAALLAVSDTGRGIDPHKLEHIFDPFFTWRDRPGGLGLGLAIVRAIVQDHNGWLDVESTPGKGTTFFIQLPLCEQGGESPAENDRERELAEQPAAEKPAVEGE